MNFAALLRTITVVTLTNIACVCSAQEHKPASAVVSARLKFLSLQSDISGVSILLDNGKLVPISAGTGYISATIDYKGSENITFVRSKPNATPSPAKSSAPAAESSGTVSAKASVSTEVTKSQVLAVAKLPATGGDLLMLFSGESIEKLAAAAIPFSAADVPAGTCLVWNVTPRNLGFSLGGQRTFIQSGQRQLIKPSSTVKNYFDLKVFDEYEGKVRALMSGDHYLNEGSRQILFIAEKTPGRAPVRVQTIEEVPEKRTRTPAAGDVAMR